MMRRATHLHSIKLIAPQTKGQGKGAGEGGSFCFGKCVWGSARSHLTTFLINGDPATGPNWAECG